MVEIAHYDKVLYAMLYVFYNAKRFFHRRSLVAKFGCHSYQNALTYRRRVALHYFEIEVGIGLFEHFCRFVRIVHRVGKSVTNGKMQNVSVSRFYQALKVLLVNLRVVFGRVYFCVSVFEQLVKIKILLLRFKVVF